jgi:phosphatidylinositol glycan class M
MIKLLHLLTSSSRRLYGFAFLIRLALIAYGHWQDNNLAVSYTDIDYHVLEDGARHVTLGQSPFERTTYRYTPLIAYLLTPNIYLTPLWGKFLFMVADLLIGALLENILAQTSNYSADHVRQCVALWLLNPIAINVSTRGNAESVVALLIVLALCHLYQGHTSTTSLVTGSALYGLSVHFKIYPILYSLPLFFFLGRNYRLRHLKTRTKKGNGPEPFMNFGAYFNHASLTFFAVSATVFVLLTAAMYWLYGYTFIYETYLYHLWRKDNRHNFSIYFYHIYLSTGHVASHVPTLIDRVSSVILSLVSFVPQMALMLVCTHRYFRQLGFCIILQTFTFVAFNKVCTVQYFIWYFSLLPLALPYLEFKSKFRPILMAALWQGAQLLWLFFAYKLEFLGENTFFQIWLSGVVYFAINVWILHQLITHFVPRSK